MSPPKAVVSWSSGKDSAFALCETVRLGLAEPVALLTTVTAPYERVSMHGVREELLNAQAGALGLPLIRVPIPAPCPNDVYEAAMRDALEEVKALGATHMVFGDLFLEDIRAYRERMLEGTGITPMFPLWGEPTDELANRMFENGLSARITCVDSKQLPKRFSGRVYDAELVASLPDGVDPCGENGEFHTLVTHCSAFPEPLQVNQGVRENRDGFVFTDFTAA